MALSIEFIPAEIVLPLAGYWVSKGDMTLAGAVFAGSLGGVSGPLVLYGIGRLGGRPLDQTRNPAEIRRFLSEARRFGSVQRPFYTGDQDADFFAVRHCEDECLGVLPLYICSDASDYVCLRIPRNETRGKLEKRRVHS